MNDESHTGVLRFALPKSERLSGRTDISDLLSKGRFVDMPGQVLRFCYRTGTGSGLNRIMVSVPKKSFKRAVKRNLLKRRIREAWRLQKHGMEASGIDILFIYKGKEVRDFSEIYECIGRIIGKINSFCSGKVLTDEQIRSDGPAIPEGQNPSNGGNG